MSEPRIVRVFIKGYNPRFTGIFLPYTIPPSGECSTFDCQNKAYGSGVMGYLCDACLRSHGLNEMALNMDGMAAHIESLTKQLHEAEEKLASQKQLETIVNNMDRLQSQLVHEGVQLTKLLKLFPSDEAKQEIKRRTDRVRSRLRSRKSRKYRN